MRKAGIRRTVSLLSGVFLAASLLAIGAPPASADHIPIAVNKSASTTTPVAGQTYDVTVRVCVDPFTDFDCASGPGAQVADADNVVLTDNFQPGVTGATISSIVFQPAGATCVIQDASGGSAVDIFCDDDGLVATASNWTIPDDANRFLVYRVSVPSSTADNANIGNTATVTSSIGNDSDSQAVTVDRQSDLEVVSKTDSADPVTAGQTFTYTVHVRNNGPSDATNVSLNDDLPPQITNAQVTGASGPFFGTCSVLDPEGTSAIDVECGPATFASGAQSFVTIQVTVENGTPSQAISNTATVVETGTSTELNAANNSKTETTNVGAAQADLTVSKTDSPDPVVAGETITYDITVTNNGPNVASDVKVFDNLPLRIENAFVSNDGPYNFGECQVLDPDGGSNPDVVCDGNVSLASGASFSIQIQATVEDDTPDGSNLENNVSVESNTPDPVGGNNTAQSNTAVETEVDMELNKFDFPDPVNVGGTLTYFLDIDNNGASQASNVVVVDNAPEELTGITATPQGFAGNFICVVNDNEGTSDPDVTCTSPTFPGNGFETIVIEGTVEDDTPDGTVLVNTAEVSADQDDDPTNNSDSTNTTVNAGADVAISKTDSADPVDFGETFQYTLEVENVGVDTAQDVFVEDDLPVEVGSATVVDDGGFTCNVIDPTGGSNPDVTCNGGTNLAPGDVRTIVIEVTEDGGVTGEVTNHARVFATNDPDDAVPHEGDVGHTNNHDDETTFIGGGDLEITKSGPAEASGGDQLNYTIEVTNNGPENVGEARVLDDADADLQNIQVVNSGGFVCVVGDAQGTSNPDVTCDGAGLDAGQTRTIELQAQVEAGANFPVFNRATVETLVGPVDPDLTNNDSEVQTAATGTLTLCPGFEHLTGHTHIVGTAGNDTLIAPNNNPHVICGLDGDDHIEGGGGNDVLDGGLGNDTAFGHGGDDAIFGRSGDDDLRGGDGNDVIRGGPGGDDVRGGGGDDHIFGGTGNDSLFGDSGSDVIRGGGNADTIRTGSGAKEIVRGGAGGDTVVGEGVDNNLLGGSGSDVLRSDGTGNNILRGGAGNDTQIGALAAGSTTSFHCGPGGGDTAVLRGGTNAVHPSCEVVNDQT